MFVTRHSVVDKTDEGKEDLFCTPKCSAMTAELFDVTFFVIRCRSLTFEGLKSHRKRLKSFLSDELKNQERKKLLFTGNAFITVA